MPIPLVHAPDRLVNQLQQNIAQALNPLLANPLVGGGIFLRKVQLASGSNAVVHTLGRSLQGWLVVRQRAAATVYDTQDSNTEPEKTLLLQASAAVTVDLYVF